MRDMGPTQFPAGGGCLLMLLVSVVLMVLLWLLQV